MKKLLFILMVFLMGFASAQGTQTVAVKVSDKTQRIGDKEYYIHIVEQGQTVFSIARAYGLKYYDAVIKTDIHLLKVGDTVWLPLNQYSVAAVSANATAVSTQNRTHYIKVEAGQTLYGISREYGVTLEQLYEANPELRTEQLKAGQMIKVPPRTAGYSPQTVSELPQEQPKVEVQPKKEEQPKTEVQTKVEEQPKTEAQPKMEEQPKVEEQPKTEVQPKKAEEQPKVEILPVIEEQPKDNVAQTRDEGETAEAKLLLRKQIVNPYPFDEVPDNFPMEKAPYYNFSTVSAFNYQVRDLHQKDRIFVTVVMPLNLDKINEISTSKFDIEQRGKKEYKVFEFIQFYEGILMALDQLQAQGCNVVLNVVDLTSDKDEDVVEAFNSHNVANSDFIIALLVKKPFDKLAELAKQHQVFVINPFSSRVDVVKNNPYVVKYMPSVEGTVKGMLDIMASKHRNGHLYLLHSNNKNAQSEERIYLAEFQKQLGERNDIKYTLFDWSANAKLLTTLKNTDDNVIVSIYDQDKNKNTTFSTALLNRFASVKSKVPVLMTVSNYLTELPNVDFEQLQHLNYTTLTTGYLDYNNPKHKKFIDTYKTKFRTEPNSLYAGVAHDIMLYFVSALSQQGAEFWRNPQQFRTPSDMLFPFSLKQHASTGGYENQSPDIYQMSNFKLIPLVSH